MTDCLKVEVEGQFFIDIGSSFHSLGAAQENALSPCFVCVVGTVNRDVLVDLSVLVEYKESAFQKCRLALRYEEHGML